MKILDPYDNWKDDPTQAAALQQNKIAPMRDEESAIIVNVPAGNYSAVVRGKNNGQGIAVVEAYNLKPSAPTKAEFAADEEFDPNAPENDGRF